MARKKSETPDQTTLPGVTREEQHDVKEKLTITAGSEAALAQVVAKRQADGWTMKEAIQHELRTEDGGDKKKFRAVLINETAVMLPAGDSGSEGAGNDQLTDGQCAECRAMDGDHDPWCETGKTAGAAA